MFICYLRKFKALLLNVQPPSFSVSSIIERLRYKSVLGQRNYMACKYINRSINKHARKGQGIHKVIQKLAAEHDRLLIPNADIDFQVLCFY